MPTTITAVGADGYVTWTNVPTNATFTVQTATSLLSESNWVDYVRVPATNGVTTNRLYDPNPPSGMVFIPAGSFTMGSPTNEAERYSDETQYTVTISRWFWMGKFLVTQADYLAVVGSNPSYYRSAHGYSDDLTRPVETVSWYDASDYCALRTQQEQAGGLIPTNYMYRLPTESEWEYADRAGTTTAFYLGSGLHSGQANFNGQREYDASVGIIDNPSGIYLRQTTAVGSYAANGWGLYDMIGNVWEWCQDWFGTYPTGSATDPPGPSSGSNRVLRGGCWLAWGWNCRSASRNGDGPSLRSGSIGFRVVLAPGQP